MKIITLSGWGQPHDALSVVASNAEHFDYAIYGSADEALAGIAQAAYGADAIIGWSLGGQMAVRAVADGLINVKKLVLIATPFQFVRSEEEGVGMARDTFDKFRGNYAKNPERTLSKAWELTALGDDNHETIRANMQKYDQKEMLKKDWLAWLDTLHGFSGNTLEFKKFPATMLIHGNNDAVVGYVQSKEFLKRIPEVRFISMEGVGHAPHWHNSELIKSYIKEYLDV